jgi:ABC-type transport system involved in cytochrome bd biosynthesis fused ATPase/permease subunit
MESSSGSDMLHRWHQKYLKMSMYVHVYTYILYIYMESWRAAAAAVAMYAMTVSGC